MFLVKQMLIGFIIGGGMILPGVSGGVLAVILGIYETMLDAVIHFFKDVKKNVIFLLPLFFGLIIGILLFGKILYFVFDQYPMEAKYTFIGLILGGLPVLIKEIETKGTKKINVMWLLVSFLISVALFVLGKDSLNIDFSTNINSGFISNVLLFATGFIFIAGKVIPGISSSFLLMLIGMYQFLLDILNNPFGLTLDKYLQLIPFFLGFIIGGICLIKIIQSLLKTYFSQTYSAILGFVVGSVAAIYPGFSLDMHGLISIVLLLLSLFVAYKFTLTEQNKPKRP